MADACNPVQRNLYPRRDGTRFTPEYQTGHGGSTYNDSLRKLSWSVPTDVTPIGQRSAGVQLPELEEVHVRATTPLFVHVPARALARATGVSQSEGCKRHSHAASSQPPTHI